MSNTPLAATSAPEPLSSEVTSSPRLAAWLAEQRVSLAFTTCGAGKLFLVGSQPEVRLSVCECTLGLSRVLGLWADGQTLWLNTRGQVWRFENLLGPGELYQGHDRLYIPKVGFTTGEVDAHDVAVDGTGRVVFVATAFSCLATLSERASFTPLWRPPFISELAAEDRCHLNGVALADGRPCFVTAAGLSDTAESWRQRVRDGGVVLEVPGGRVLASGLSMPHSPRLYRDRLWLHNTGAGQFGSIDPGGGPFEPLTFCPGFLRGLTFVGDYAVVGLSRPRHGKTFAGLLLEEELAKRGQEARSGLLVIDLTSGAVVHWLWLAGMVRELYDVVVLPRVSRPLVLGFKSDEILRTIVIGDDGAL
jgi:uncharacterized protein (TIGR03032 family)